MRKFIRVAERASLWFVGLSMLGAGLILSALTIYAAWPAFLVLLAGSAIGWVGLLIVQSAN